MLANKFHSHCWRAYPPRFFVAALLVCTIAESTELQTHTLAAPAKRYLAFGQPMNYAAPLNQPHESFNPSTLSALDDQPYGCIKLGKSGRVIDINVAASAVLGVRRADALKKCFFTEVAPCADIPTFHGYFKTAMAGNGVLNKVIDHRFLLSHLQDEIAGVSVRVHLFSSTDESGRPVVWIVTRKKLDTPAGSQITSRPESRFERAQQPRANASDARDATSSELPAARRRIQSISSEFDTSI